MDKKELDKLAEHFNLTNFESYTEEYILTPEEEEKAIAHELKRLTDHWEYKLARAGKSKVEIASRIKIEKLHERIDRESVLRTANSNKAYDIWQKEQREFEAKLQKDQIGRLINEWTANRIFQLIRWTAKNVYNKNFVIDNSNKELVSCFCFMLSRDERLETDWKYSLNKGLLIRGASGLGKTFIAECAQDNPLNPIKIVSILEIQEKIRKYGEYEIEMSGRKILYIDDVGTEDWETRNFGNDYNWFKTFVEKNYLTKQIPFNRLIVSTNLSSDQLEARYGYRVRSRVRDMFNVIDVMGEDRRGR